MSRAVSVEPSGDFDGDDGKWSTFAIQIGTPPQVVKLLVATSGQETWTITPDACTEDDDSCSNGRGYIFNMSSSSTWSENGFYELSDFSNLGQQGDGYYGFDVLRTGWPGSPGVQVNRSIVAGTSTGPYIGLLGISPRPTNFSDFNSPEPSLLTLLKESGQISSLSYGYTAGAHYHGQGMQASLTLGGYDKARLSPESVQYSFNPVTYRDLVAQLSSISVHTNPTDRSQSARSTPLLESTINPFLDAGTPHIWLPESACLAFETVLGLQYSPSENHYFLNSSTHDNLLKTNYTFIFTLTDPSSSSHAVNITIPYAAFDLELNTPDTPDIDSDSTPRRYFPIRRAESTSQYTLGRAFWQEVYTVVDYERGNFSVHAAVHDTQATTIVPIDPLTSDDDGNNNIQDSSSHNQPTKPPPIKIIVPVVVVMALLVIAVVAIYVFHKRRRRIRKGATDTTSNNGYLPELPGRDARHELPASFDPGGTELDAGMKHELEGAGSHAHMLDGSTKSVGELDGKVVVGEMDAGTAAVAVELDGNATVR